MQWPGWRELKFSSPAQRRKLWDVLALLHSFARPSALVCTVLHAPLHIFCSFLPLEALKKASKTPCFIVVFAGFPKKGHFPLGFRKKWNREKTAFWAYKNRGKITQNPVFRFFRKPSGKCESLVMQKSPYPPKWPFSTRLSKKTKSRKKCVKKYVFF